MTTLALPERLPNADALELLQRIDRLPEKQRAEVMERYRKKKSGDTKIWFCKRGRRCDGEPHDGVPYRHARGDQWPPVGIDWDTWFYMSGRGAGKTKAGGHWTRQMAQVTPRIALIGRRGTDVRATMVEGPAGLIVACEEAGESWDWKPALKEFTFENGAKAFGYSGEEPESLRGPEHGAGWIDEPCHITLIEEVWSNYTLGLRSQGVPGGAKTLLTSSPLPVPWTKERIAEKGQEILDAEGKPQIDEEGDVMTAPKTVLVQVPTSVNIKNLDEGYKRRVINPLRGTRKGKQELDAMLLEDVEGALWESDWLSRERFVPSDMEKIVVAVDPAGTEKKGSDLCGIVVVGKRRGVYHVFEDATGSFTPEGWAKEAQRLYAKYEADSIVLERYGGDTATTVLTLSGFKGKIHQVKARRGKALRADPIAALYEQRVVTHQEFAELADLEDQMLTWVPDVTPGSPDRIDALVWGLTHLSGKEQGETSWGVPKTSKESTTKDRGPGSRFATKNWRKGLAR